MKKRQIIFAVILLMIIALIALGAIVIGYDHNLDEIPDSGYRLGSDEVFMQVVGVSIDSLNNKSIVIESEEDLEAAFHVYRELDQIADLNILLDTYPLEENVLYISFYWANWGEVTPHAMVVVPETNTIYMECDHSGGNHLNDSEPAIVMPCTCIAFIPKAKVEGLDFSEYKSYYLTSEYEEAVGIGEEEVNRQLQLLYDNSNVWGKTDSSDYEYAISDLDRDGYLEIITASDDSSELYIYEVSENDLIIEWDISELQQGPYKPDLLGSGVLLHTQDGTEYVYVATNYNKFFDITRSGFLTVKDNSIRYSVFLTMDRNSNEETKYYFGDDEITAEEYDEKTRYYFEETSTYIKLGRFKDVKLEYLRNSYESFAYGL
ncbi:MAG: hypothetical protein KBG42_06230 [Lachnospiraceae bacterium]|nr:hypothetical protein [Lachnospiraceae bacterium]